MKMSETKRIFLYFQRAFIETNENNLFGRRESNFKIALYLIFKSESNNFCLILTKVIPNLLPASKLYDLYLTFLGAFYTL